MNIISESLEGALDLLTALGNAAEKVGLSIYVEKIKILELVDSDLHQDEFDSITFEKFEEFSYLGLLLIHKNDWSWDISVRIANAERASFALSIFLKSKALTKKKKLILYTAIIRPTLTYVCEIWTATASVILRRLRTFESKIRMIC